METLNTQLSGLLVEPGVVIAGRFEICERLGAGGMGMVYRAIDRELEGEEVALKLLLPHLAQDEQVFKRFRQEVQVARSLSHPNIVRTHDIGRAPGEIFYISMEYVKGVSLKDMLRARQLLHDEDATHNQQTVSGTAFAFDEALRIIYQLCSGLAYAHAKGVIHRDIKPANVLLSDSGEVKIADFGTARFMGLDTTLTQAGQVIGTPDYMSPEQIRGEQLDQSCDIYSLGILAYELVVGVRPFAADTSLAVAFKHLHEPLPAINCEQLNVPRWFEQLLQKASSKKKSERFQSVIELASTLLEQASYLSSLPAFFSLDRSVLDRGALNRIGVERPGVDIPLASQSKSDLVIEFDTGNLDKTLVGDIHGEIFAEKEWRLDWEEQSIHLGAQDLQMQGVANMRAEKKPWLAVALLLLSILLVGLAYLSYSHGPFFKHLGSLRLDKSRQIRERTQVETETLITKSETREPILAVKVEKFEKLEKAEPLPVPLVPPKATLSEVKAEVFYAELELLPAINSQSVEAAQPLEAVSLTEASRLRWVLKLKREAGNSGPLAEALKSEVLRNKISINVFDKREGVLLGRLTANSVEISNTGTEAELRGSFASLSVLRAGSFRIDVVNAGELLKSRDLLIYKTRAKPFVLPAGQPVMQPVVIPQEESQSSDVLPAEEISVSSGKSERVSELSSLSGLPLARSRELLNEPPAKPITQPEVEPQAAALEVQQFAGKLKLPASLGGEKTLRLDLSFVGQQVLGKAQLEGYPEFQVKGRVHARGLELELKNTEQGIRLSGSGQAKLKGLFYFPSINARGGWEATKK